MYHSLKLLLLCSLILVFVTAFRAAGPVPLSLAATPAVTMAATAEGVKVPNTGLRADAPPYALHGPFWVGTRDMTMKTNDGEVYLTVWYPGLNPNGVAEQTNYSFSPLFNQIPGTVRGHAIRDAEPDKGNGPYPLIVFSIGLATPHPTEAHFGEHLASYGFVVIAPDYRGETPDVFWQGAYYRPVDTLRTIQFADTLTAANGDLAGVIKMDRIGIAGHSSGGWSALTGAGAQMNLGGCPVNPGKIEGLVWYSDCSQFLPHQNELASMFGLKSTPDGLWPAMFDSRVTAVAALNPDGDIWGVDYSGVAVLKVPAMIFTGTNDMFNPPVHAAYPIYDHLGSSSKSLVVFEGANHLIPLSTCDDMPGLAEMVGAWFCSDSVWDMNRAHDLLHHFITAFMLDNLKGDKDAHKALLPDTVQFPGIEYKTTMK